MDGILKATEENRMRNVYVFYMIIFGLLIGVIGGEILIEEFLLLRSITFFEHMIPGSILYGVIIWITILYMKKSGLNYSDLGIHKLYLSRSLIVGLFATSGFLIGVAAFQLPIVYTSILDILLILAFTLLIGLTEETAFRGYIQGSYQKVMSQVKAVLLAGLLFGLLHVPSIVFSGDYFRLLSLPILITVGVILGFIRVYTGNIWGVVIAHATYDFYLFMFTGVITPATDIMILLGLLFSVFGMWGTIVVAIFVAKGWIDRPEQRPGELTHKYTLKIDKLRSRVLRLQHELSVMKLSLKPKTRRITNCSLKLKLNEEFLEIFQKYLPQVNDLSYKIIPEVVYRRTLIARADELIAKSHSPKRIAELEGKKELFTVEIQNLEIELEKLKNYNSNTISRNG